jgi:serine/threonine protein kinase
VPFQHSRTSLIAISFAMLTGFPPFQSSSQEEIYRKVKTLEYVWPKDFDSSGNYIPKEAKDLVSSCLNLNPEDRPDPDEIVDHSFFKMYLRCIPKAIDSSCRVTKPVWLKQQDPRGDAMESTFGMDTDATDNFFTSCGVGHNSQGKMLACVGEKVNKTASLECLEEEYSGLNPVVPIAETAIYSPDYKLDREGNMIPLWGSDQPKHIDDSDDSPPLSRATSMSSIINQAELPLRSLPKIRPAPQSHAATLRQQAHSSRPLPPNSMPVELRTLTASTGTTRRHLVVATDPPVSSQPAIPPRDPTRLLSRPSVRSSSRIASSESLRLGMRPKPPALPRSQTSGDVRSDRRQRTAISYTSRGAVTEDKALPELPGELPKEQSKEHKKTKEIVSKIMAKPTAPIVPEVISPPSFLDPSDPVEIIPHTQPDVILAQLKVFLENLKVAAKDLERGTRTRRQKQENPNHLVVSKWVDYTNKFGIGYILSDGTVGCLYKATTSLPSSSIAVRGGEHHLRKKKQDDLPYPERAQIVPQNGPPVEFLESNPNGLKRLYVDPKDFDVDKRVEKNVYSNPYYQEKLKRLNLWDKFGKYMTTTLGNEDNLKLIAEVEKKHKAAGGSDPGYVRFYQRCGNVGIWGFGDGAFQFNFPDHTKLLVSNQGNWIDFCVLRLQDALDMAKTCVVTASALEKREVLSMPTAQMKYQCASTRPDSKNVLKANDFEEKMGWAENLLARWIEHGGTGLLGETGRNRPGFVAGGEGDEKGGKGEKGYWFWEGTRELAPPKDAKEGWSEKLVWVSVGGSSGRDTPYEALVRRAA